MMKQSSLELLLSLGLQLGRGILFVLLPNVVLLNNGGIWEQYFLTKGLELEASHTQHKG